MTFEIFFGIVLPMYRACRGHLKFFVHPQDGNRILMTCPAQPSTEMPSMTCWNKFDPFGGPSAHAVRGTELMTIIFSGS